MFLTSLLAGFGLLCIPLAFSPGEVTAVVLWGAMVGAVVELVTSSEWDTVTVPAAATTFLLPLSLLL